MVFSLVTGWVVDNYSYVPVFIGFGILPLIAAAIVWSLPDPACSSPDLLPNQGQYTQTPKVRSMRPRPCLRISFENLF